MDNSLTTSIAAILPQGGILLGDEAKEHAVSSWSRMGTPLAFVRPSTTEQVSRVLALCNEAGVAVAPWGGKTGLVHGGNADNAVALSLERMAAIELVDKSASTLSVEAGCILELAANAAAAEGLLLPLDLGARGSATIGGVISTNAGGNRVLRYGMMRDMVLGLEAVLADGTIVTSMNGLIKNNAGYDLKQLFIGSEGTLGVVTRAVIRLRPLPESENTALLAVGSFERLPILLRAIERKLGGSLSAFEVMWNEFFALVTSEPAVGRSPFEGEHPFYVLIESQGADQQADQERFETVLMEALEEGLISDAVIAKSSSERGQLWSLRDDISQTARNWPIFTFDVSLRIADMEQYVEEVRAALAKGWGNKATLTVFGHLGDGNLHLVIGVGQRDRETKHAVERIVYAGLRSRGGSISAEHGIGLEKRDYLEITRSPNEISLMRMIKAALDPRNILNPGKILA